MNDQRSLRPDSEALNERLRVLKESLPECFTEGRLDPVKLRETLGDENLDEGLERYGLTWPGKRESRTRAFKPSNMALHFAPGEGVNESTTRNLVIEGENLEVLRLLQKAYRGRVKMIYIDPPYNTGNDFVYDDKFAESPLEYEKRTGLRAEDGTALQSNRKSSGRFHSNWLSMMYPRLILARELLADDGVIFVSIDDSEMCNLELILDETFGEESFLGNIVWHSKKGGGGGVSTIVSEHEYVVTFAAGAPEESIGKKLQAVQPLDLVDANGPFRKGRELNKWGAGSAKADRPTMFFGVPGPDGKLVFPTRNDGSDGRWRLGKPGMMDIVSRGDALFEKRDNGTYIVYEKIRSTEPRQVAYRTLIADAGSSAEGTATLKELFGGKAPFDFSKPVSLIAKLAKIANVNRDSIVLDFFAGSGTTAQAVLELNEEDGGNRQFILVQMPEETSEDSEAAKAGYKTIAEIAKERVRRVIKKINKEKGKLTDRDRGFRVLKLARTGFKEWQDFAGGSLEEYEKQLSLHLAETDDKVKDEDLVAEIMLKEGFPLDARIEKLEEGSLAVTRVESEASPHRLFVCLDAGIGRSLTVRTFEKLGVAPEDVFVCRDDALTDEAKLRIRELCRLATV